MPNKPPIHDLASLHREKDRLKMQITQAEKGLEDTGDYFRTNYRNIIWSYINPLKDKGALGGIVGFVKSALLPTIATISIDDIKSGRMDKKPLVGVAAGLAAGLIKKFLKRKKGKEGDATKNNA